MTNDKAVKIVAIAALVIAIFGVSLGFAAFSRNLTITDTGATVTPTNNMYVYFAASKEKGADDSLDISPVSAEPRQYRDAEEQDEMVATIDNSTKNSPKISGLYANFTEPGQSVSYTFYAYNAWEYSAYLKNITMSKTPTCTAITTIEDEATRQEEEERIDRACSGISISLSIGENSKLITTEQNQSNIKNHSLGSGEFEPIVVTISYASGSSVAATDFSAEFSDIILNYGSTN